MSGLGRQSQRSAATPGLHGLSLYEAFKREHDAVWAAREAALKALRQQHLAYAHRLKAYYRERFRHERLTGLRGCLKRDAFQHIAEQQPRDRAERVQREATNGDRFARGTPFRSSRPTLRTKPPKATKQR
jgi:hypothetical protein